MPKTPFSIDLIGQFSLTASESSFIREGELFFQLRDRFGRWVDMGKGVKFKIRLKNGKYHSVLGVNTGKGASDNTRGLIKVENDPYLPNGNYPVSSANLQQYIGLLTEEELAESGIELGKDVSGNVVTAREDSAIPNIDDIIAEAEDISSPVKELKTEITGDEIQDIKISSIAKALKAEGRFPVPRQSSLDTWGKTSDATKGAKLDYSKVYEGMSSEDPEFAEKYPTFDSFWNRVVDLAVDERTQSPNDLNQINQEMKEINKGYAKHVLGLDPENGTFTVYRNAINNAFEEKDAAVGYVSTSKNLAFDYNAGTRAGEFSNGRYEITVKPDEVNGMIGYSQVEDEYALTIGQGVTYQEGRVKKVGELETVKVAPWHEEAVGKLKRGQGATPFRGHSFVGQFDFLPISKNPMQVDKLQDFLDDNNMTMDDWKNKFDELHGEGAYQRFKDSGRENQVSLQSLERMFVDLGDGTYGLDITKLSPAGNDSAGSASYGDTQNTSSFVNDYVDNKLKFLSLIQEITGEPFMVHKNNSRNKEVVGDPEPTTEQPINVSELPEVENVKSVKVDSVKIEEVYKATPEEEYSIYEYQGSNYAVVNKFSRVNPDYTFESRENFDPQTNSYIIDNIDKIDRAIGSHKITEEVDVYRGTSLDREKFDKLLSNLDVGRVYIDGAYLSTSTNLSTGLKFAVRKLTTDKDRVPVIYKGKLLPNQKALRVKDLTSADLLEEDELLLPRNTVFKITKVSKLSKDGSKELDIQLGSDDMDAFNEAKEIIVFEGEYVQEPDKKPSVSDLPEVKNLPKTKAREVQIENLYETTEDEDTAVEEYQGASYEQINKFSRKYPNYTASRQNLNLEPSKTKTMYTNDYLMDNIDMLDRAIGAYKIKQGAVVYRGTSLSKERFDELIGKLNVGDFFIDPGYLSTSTDPQVSVKFATSKVIQEQGREEGEKNENRVPIIFKGNLLPEQSALRVADTSGVGDESEEEILLPRNTSFKITKISKVTNAGSGISYIPESIKEIIVFEGEYVKDPAPIEQTTSAEETSSVPITPAEFIETYSDVSNWPTYSSEAMLAKEIYNLMLGSGLTADEIAQADPSYKEFKELNMGLVTVEEQQDFGLEIINRLKRNWNDSSKNESVEALQHIAQKLFNPEGAHKLPTPTPEVLEYAKHRLVYEAFLKAMYDNTQKYFADNKIKKLVVYRGLSGPIEALKNLQKNEVRDIGALQGAPMASWTLDRKEATYFAGKGTILRSEIPVSSVLSMPFTGLFGVHSEQELVVLGMPRNTKATGYDMNLEDSEEMFSKFKELDDKFDASKPLEVDIVEPATPVEENVSIPIWSPEYGKKIPTLYHGSGVDFKVGDIIDYKSQWAPAKMGGIFSEEQDELEDSGYATKKFLGEEFVFASDDFSYAADYAHTPRLNQFEDPEDGFVYEVEPLDPTSLQHLMPNEIGSPVGYRITKKMDKEGVEIVEPESLKLIDEDTAEPESEQQEEPAKLTLPLPPRSLPIPEGHVRLFHYTNDSAVESIRKNGLIAQEDGAAVADDNVSLIWAMEGAPAGGDEQFNQRPIVEFHVPKEVWEKGAGLGFEKTAMNLPVPPENILSIHEPWHDVARLLLSYSPEERKRTLDIMSSIPSIRNSYENKKAIDYVEGLEIEESIGDEDFYIEDPAGGAPKKVTFSYEETKIAGFDEDAILVTAFFGDRKLPIATLHLDSKTRMVKNISVLDDYQRKGVATELWKYAQKQGLEPKHSPLKTPEGQKWAESLKEDTDIAGVIDVVDEESTKQRIESGLDNWMPVLFDLLDSLEEDEEGEEITNDERGNILQSKFIEAAGFNGKPKLVTQEEFDAINSETLYRAVSNEKFIDNYINSETQYAGEGTSGNGTYTTNKRQTAEGFAGDTANKKEVINKRLMEIKLASDANILYLERTSDWRAWIEENKEILLEKAKQFGANPRNIWSIESKLTSTTDWSNYAIMLGYDGFRVSAGNNEYYTIILNRGKVILNDKSSPDEDTDIAGVIDVVSEEATKERLGSNIEKFSERTIPFTEDGRSQVKVLRIAIELGEDLAYIDWEPSGEIYYIKVPAEYRRQGIATRLWEAAKEHARKSGLPPPTLSEYRTDEGDAWAESLGEELPPRVQA